MPNALTSQGSAVGSHRVATDDDWPADVLNKQQKVPHLMTRWRAQAPCSQDDPLTLACWNFVFLFYFGMCQATAAYLPWPHPQCQADQPTQLLLRQRAAHLSRQCTPSPDQWPLGPAPCRAPPQWPAPGCSACGLRRRWTPPARCGGCRARRRARSHAPAPCLWAGYCRWRG
jgi:hypothetical protein